MSYGYDVYYPPTEYAQPQADPYFVHPNSAAVQLGLTPEEIREVVEEQERWFREEIPAGAGGRQSLGEYRTPGTATAPG